MSYKKIENFQPILNDENFSYISNLYNIKQIKRCIKNLSSANNNIEDYKNLLQKYITSINSWYVTISKNRIYNVTIGYTIITQEINRILTLYDEDQSKREEIKWKTCKKFKQNFEKGISFILKGLRELFNTEKLTTSTLPSDVLKNYILNKNEGLGKNYKLNIKGKFAFVTKLNDLSRNELISVIKLLTNSSENQIRIQCDWVDLGCNGNPVRILLKKKSFGRRREIFYLFKTKGEHDEYQKTLRYISPNKEVAFA